MTRWVRCRQQLPSMTGTWGYSIVKMPVTPRHIDHTVVQSATCLVNVAVSKFATNAHFVLCGPLYAMAQPSSAASSGSLSQRRCSVAPTSGSQLPAITTLHGILQKPCAATSAGSHNASVGVHRLRSCEAMALLELGWKGAVAGCATLG